jgi:outer membrane protein assembly factor BamA
VDFFGVGPRGPEVETDFSVSGTAVEVVLQSQPADGLGFVLRAGLLDLDVGSGTDDRTPNLEERFSANEVPGLLGQPRYATAGLGAITDTRDQAEVPTTGGFFGAAVWRFIPLDAQAESFTRLALDWREFRPIVRSRPDRHVLAFRLLASVDQAATGSPVPFYLQNWLGGSHTLRSYESYRLRGQAVFHVSIEHRWRVRRFLEIGSFVDSGAVATRVPRLVSSQLEIAKGIGVRLRSDKRLYFRLDWAHGAEGSRVVFSLSPAF